MIQTVIEDDLYYTVAVLLVCVAAFDLGLLIGWLMVVL